MRVQTTSKFLPGLFDNLITGRVYAIGNNGSIVQAAAGDVPVGIAAGVNDLQFFGAQMV